MNKSNPESKNYARAEFPARKKSNSSRSSAGDNIKEILVLFPKNDKPTKILDKNLEKIKGFDAGWLYKFKTIEYKSFHAVLKKIFLDSSCFMVLGEPTEFGEQFEANDKYGPRRKKKGQPTIQDRDGTEMVLDLDDHIIPNFDALNPEKALINWCRKRKIDCDFTWQITSSQKLGTEEARVRIFFSLDKPHSLQQRKAWSQSEKIGADGSVYTCSQPIYTAAPIIEDGIDPIKNRTGFVKGKMPFFTLPKMSVEAVEKYASISRTSSEYDFNDSTLPPEVLSGQVYRRYFMPLAFHYINLLKGDEEATFHIIRAKSLQVESREFDAQNVREYIADAKAQIEIEKEEDVKLLTAEDIEEEERDEIAPLPEFPENLLESWPHPWPMIWKEFKKIPRQLEEALLIPTVLALNGYFLKSRYGNIMYRRPNMFYINLTPSTGNKDVNSKNVIRDLDREFRRRGSMVSLFSGILNTESSITSDTSFISSFSPEGELFWINTEATRIFQQLKMAGANSSVAALADKLIEVVDGHEITGKSKVSGKVKSIPNPNVQVLFYAQPETIERFLDEDLVDSGLFGRANLSIVPELKFDTETYTMFHDEKKHTFEISDEFYNFYASKVFSMGNMTLEVKRLVPTKKDTDKMNEWAREKIAPLMKESDLFQKVLSRIGNSVEQLYTIVLGICQLYDASQALEVRKSIPVECLFPLAEYWAATKIYAINNYVQSALDPLSDAIVGVLKNMISGKPAMKRLSDRKILQEFGVVPASQLMDKILNHQKLSRSLSSDGDRKNVTVRIENILKVLVRNGIVVEAKIGPRMRLCYGLPQ